MRILISGASGLVGQELSSHLRIQGHEVSALTRSRNNMLPGDVYWKPSESVLEKGDLEGFDSVVHLAGESIANGRWNEEKKQRILDSRVNGTRLLAENLAQLNHKPKSFICASAVGYYGDRGEEVLTEESAQGKGFLPDVCAAWENASQAAKDAGIRTVNTRIGIVLTPDGAALRQMLVPFLAGVGGRIGPGRQYMSWLSLEELVRIIDFSIHTPALAGPVNGVSPNAVRNIEFTKTLGQIIRRPTIFPLPAFAARMVLGEMADELLLAGMNVKPQKLIDAGYTFTHPKLKKTLEDLLTDFSFSEMKMFTETWLSHHRSEVFSFFCDPKNLERITPPFLNFKIESQTTEEIEENTEFTYKLSLRGIPIRWHSRIVNWKPEEEFADTQLSGPYKKWFHTHRFFDHHGGTLMTDEVEYRVPFGVLGRIAAGWYVKKDVQKIFDYRKKVIGELFSEDHAEENQRESA